MEKRRSSERSMEVDREAAVRGGRGTATESSGAQIGMAAAAEIKTAGGGQGAREGEGLLGALKKRRVVSGQRRLEPHVVAHLCAEGRFERVRQRQRRMRMVEASEVRGDDGCARKESRWKRGQRLNGVLDEGRIWRTMATDEVSAKTSSLDDFVGASFTIGEFGNSASGSIPVDLSTGHD
jgi:hypothetical protein